MSRSFLLAQADEKRAVEGMCAREKKLSENDKKIMESNNRLALPGPFRSYTPVFKGQFNPYPNERRRRDNIKSRQAAVIVNPLKKKNEAVKSAFLQAMSRKVRPHLSSNIGSYLISRKNNAFAAKHKKTRTYNRKKSKKMKKKSKKIKKTSKK